MRWIDGIPSTARPRCRRHDPARAPRRRARAADPGDGPEHRPGRRQHRHTWTGQSRQPGDALGDLTPAACTSGTPASLVTGSGVFNGTTQNDLMLGSTAIDTMDGRQQNDCILGGAGNDTIDGFNGTDVCIGGPGTDTFVRCETAMQ